MRLKLSKKQGIRNCYVNLPASSPFKMELNTNNDQISLALKVVFGEQVFYFGYAGGTSEEVNTIEISEDLANCLKFPDGAHLEVSIQYTIRNLKRVEFEPITADDYEIVRHFAEEIEYNLLNQIGVFYNGLLFPCYVGPNLQYRILFQVNIKEKILERAECFMLSQSCEITIPPKTRNEKQVKQEEEDKREMIKEHKQKVFSNILEERKSSFHESKDNFEHDKIVEFDAPSCSTIIRNYKKSKDLSDFYYIYTSEKLPKAPVCVTVKNTKIATFKEYLKDDQNDDLNVINEQISLIMLPVHCSELTQNQYYLCYDDIFDNQSLKGTRTYTCTITPLEEPIKDISDLVYKLKCQFFHSGLESLFGTDGLAQKVIIKEIFESYIYDCYSNNDSMVIINNGVVIKLKKKLMTNILKRLLIKWRDIEQSVYHSDQMTVVIQKILQSGIGSNDNDFSYDIDEIEDSEIFESLQRNKKNIFNEDNECLHIECRLESKKDPSKTQDYKIITSIKDFDNNDNKIVEFVQSKELSQTPDISIESELFTSLYNNEVIVPIIEHYSLMLQDKLIEPNYIMLYGQKGAGKTFVVKTLLPKLLNSVEFEYLDLNYFLMLNSDLIKCMKYLLNFFLHSNNPDKKKVYVIDHLDCALPNVDSSEMMSATRKIKQNQVLEFFLELIDSKKYNLLFVGRHYQNINSELAGVSRIDKFVHINAPDSKKRVKAFEHIINYSYKQRIGKFECKMHEIDQDITKPKLLNSICNQLAAKTEHYKFSNLVQVGKTFLKSLQNKVISRRTSSESQELEL